MQVSFQPLQNIEASKSIMNRLLVCKSYFPILKITGESHAEDVEKLNLALSNLNQKVFDVGSGGTTFRFLLMRLSRYPGAHTIKLSEQLANRPHKDLSFLLDQLGIEYEWQKNQIIVYGGNWQWHDSVRVNVEKSSQFVSALILNAWLLPKDMDIFFDGTMVSRTYFQMSLEILNYLGMDWEVLDEGIRIKANQSIKTEEVHCEIDMSSAFVVAALSAISCEAKIEQFLYPSVQGDSKFLEIFEELGVPFMLSNQSLKILPAKDFKPINWDLKDTPDLFPVLAVLCTLCQGQSKLSGLKHLAYKESSRFDTTCQLLDAIGANYEKQEDSITIEGDKDKIVKEFTSIETHLDHRIAFAAALAKLHGHNLLIRNPECVNKSFPDFWQQFNFEFPSQDLYS